MPARREGFAFHHGHLVLVLVDAIMHDVVDSGSGAKVAWFELVHILGSGRPQSAVGRGCFVRYFSLRRRREQQQ